MKIIIVKYLLTLIIIATLTIDICIPFTSANVLTNKEEAIEVFDDAESQLAIYPNDDEETANLKDEQKIFSDLCLNYRDLIKSDIQRTTSDLVTQVFSVFYHSLEKFSKKAIEAAKEQLDELSHKNADSVPSATELEGETPEPPHVSPLDIMKENAKDLFKQVKDVLGASVSNTVSVLTSGVRLDSLTEAVVNTCLRVLDYQDKFRSQLEEFIHQLDQSSAIYQSVKSTESKDLQCVTAVRIEKLAKFCKHIKSMQNLRG